MKLHALALSALMGLTVLAPATAQTSVASAAAPAGAATSWTAAQVRKLDLAAGKITLKHEEIKNLDMPPMTMVFSLHTPAAREAAAGLKVGDKLQFEAAMIDGRTVVVAIKR